MLVPILNIEDSMSFCMKSLVCNSKISKILLIQNGVSSDIKKRKEEKVLGNYISQFNDIRINYLIIEKKGTLYSLNDGIAKTNSSFIMFSSSHAYYDEKYADKLIEVFKKKENTGAIGERVVCVSKDVYSIISSSLNMAFKSFFCCFSFYGNFKKSTAIKKNKKIYDTIYNREALITIDLFNEKKSKEFGLPCVVAVRNTDVNTFFKYMIIHLWSLGKKTLKSVKKIVFISKAYKRYSLNKFLTRKGFNIFVEKTVVLPNGINKFWFENTYTRKIISSTKERIDTHED